KSDLTGIHLSKFDCRIQNIEDRKHIKKGHRSDLDYEALFSDLLVETELDPLSVPELFGLLLGRLSVV
ncbi:MAG: hypothetical protein ACM3YE_15420, partial [Bacteroidota bacterium]